ncbi:hypothetical protein G7Y89_g11830 [Cudoniella acicularis]|uniref:Protein NO VEIN C-terminal domain-containing protein n=1 Tax=Cudoniella acicularis TaxID=354080 RepID=A0A8H4RDU1_9HELO|nr:hypothetical protein G7Y89_g11830 [Cudoniella acicularis]
MQSKIPLLARYRLITDTSLPVEFFREPLLIQNTTSVDLLEELEFMRQLKSEVCLDNIKDIYVRLNAMRQADESISDKIRERFETSGLIWIQSEINCWKSPSFCLWSSKAQITDRHTVSGQYGQGEHKKALKGFFVDCLNVAEPTLDMLAEELQLQARPLAGIVLSDDSGWKNKDHYASDQFDVSQWVWTDGSLRLESTTGEFSIRGRENYWEAFNKRVPMLDLTLEEVHDLEPFLRWMDLESRYLSNRVTERPEFSGTLEECSKKLTKDLRFRATALFRYAVHFKSPRSRGKDSSLFPLLSRAKVYQTSGISTFLDPPQIANSKETIVTVLNSTSKLHIEQKSLVGLEIDSTSSSEESDDEGGSQTSIDSFAATASSSHSSALSDDSTSTFSSSPSPNTGTVPRSLAQLPEAITVHPHLPRVLPSVVHGDSVLRATLESQGEYVKLLGRIREAAREENIPTRGLFDMSSLTNAIEDESPSDSPHTTTAFGTRTVNQLKHDMKIGAAGLRASLIPPPFPSGRKLNMNPRNWPSSIRDYVRVHPNCAADFPEVEKPVRRGQTDIIFDDEDGDFTQYLIDKLYLGPERYRGAKPKYFIEVKTMLKKCDTRFYMSKSQYGQVSLPEYAFQWFAETNIYLLQMHDIAAKQDDVVQDVYLIFRVFHLDTQNIGLRIYSDPGELDFAEESYTVTPKVALR